MTISHLTIFSPLGQVAPFITNDAALDEVPTGGQDSYTVSGDEPARFHRHADLDHGPLARRVSRTARTTSGGITTEPTVNGQDLTWTGPFDVPAGGTLEFVIGVTVADVGGIYTDSVDGIAAVAVVGTGDTAPVTVVELVVAFTG